MDHPNANPNNPYPWGYDNNAHAAWLQQTQAGQSKPVDEPGEPIDYLPLPSAEDAYLFLKNLIKEREERKEKERERERRRSRYGP